jgi:DNA-binding transcriptional MerR regulator
MKIGELARAAAVPPSTLRYWDEIGILKAAARVGGQRRYGPEAVHVAAVLKLAQACGLSLPEIRQLLHGFKPGFKASRRWRQVLAAKQLQLDAQIERLQAMRELVSIVQTCDCSELMDCGRRAASVMGPE